MKVTLGPAPASTWALVSGATATVTPAAVTRRRAAVRLGFCAAPLLSQTTRSVETCFDLGSGMQ